MDNLPRRWLMVRTARQDERLSLRRSNRPNCLRTLMLRDLC